MARIRRGEGWWSALDAGEGRSARAAGESGRRPRRSLGGRSALAAGALLLAAVFSAAGMPPTRGAVFGSPQRIMHAGRPAFGCEAITFLQGDSAFAALTIEVPYSELSFELAGGGLEARFDLILHILDGDRQRTGEIWHERVHAPDRAALRGRGARYERRLLLPLDPGRHQLEVAVSEPGSGHEGRVRLALEIPLALPGHARLSPLLIGPCGLEGDTGTLLADARVKTSFVDPAETLCAYAEVFHPGTLGGQMRVVWLLAPETGIGGEARGEFARGAGEGRTRLSWPLPAGELLLEDYRLAVSVEVGSDRLEGETRFDRRIESDISLAPFFRDLLDALGYIAEERDLAPLRMAAPQERARLWEEFWRRRDPTPETERNEVKEEFLARLRHAQEEFTGTRPGWKTDRGRIYIVHGAPGTIERFPYRPEGPATEIWTYEQQGLRFVFVDRHGFGEFVLWREGY